MRSSAYAEIDAAVAEIKAKIAGESDEDTYIAPRDTRGTQVSNKAADMEAYEAMGTMEAAFNLRKASIDLLKATSKA
ncbi:hypothetical protein SAMN03159339_5249 [Variovorax sp. 770b2]|nr:hypothetical protein SAMN03159339_5249 [Variovorax sp. 770b2]